MYHCRNPIATSVFVTLLAGAETWPLPSPLLPCPSLPCPSLPPLLPFPVLPFPPISSPFLPSPVQLLDLGSTAICPSTDRQTYFAAVLSLENVSGGSDFCFVLWQIVGGWRIGEPRGPKSRGLACLYLIFFYFGWSQYFWKNRLQGTTLWFKKTRQLRRTITTTQFSRF